MPSGRLGTLMSIFRQAGVPGVRLMTSYAVIIEGEGDSYSGYVPDLPGCVAPLPR